MEQAAPLQVHLSWLLVDGWEEWEGEKEGGRETEKEGGKAPLPSLDGKIPWSPVDHKTLILVFNELPTAALITRA